jgi:hypothetical protein
VPTAADARDPELGVEDVAAMTPVGHAAVHDQLAHDVTGRGVSIGYVLPRGPGPQAVAMQALGEAGAVRIDVTGLAQRPLGVRVVAGQGLEPGVGTEWRQRWLARQEADRLAQRRWIFRPAVIPERPRIVGRMGAGEIEFSQHGVVERAGLRGTRR